MLAPVPEAKAAAAAPPSSALIPCSSAWRFGLLLRVYMNPRPSPDQRCGPRGQLKFQFSLWLIFRTDATGCKCDCRSYAVAAFGVDSRMFSELTALFAQRK